MTGAEYLERKLNHICVASGCRSDAQDDSLLCAPHHLAYKARRRKSNHKIRASRRQRGRCIDCGNKSKLIRCSECDIRVHPVLDGEHKQSAGEHAKAGIWREDPGTSWMRYRGKGRRGRLTREEQAAEDKRDARWAIAEIEKFIEAVDVVISPEVQELPRIQREAAKREAAQFLGVAGRFLDELLDKYG